MTKARIVMFNKLPTIPSLPDNKYIINHINSIKSPIYKTLSALSYSLLEDMLKNEFGKDIKDLEISQNDNGKPDFRNSGIFFNISHTEGAIACVVSEKAVGIDIEKIKEYNKKLIRYFTNEEKYINNNYDFFKFWTLKESYIKAIGVGLSHGLKSIKFTASDDSAKNIICIDNSVISPYFFYTKNTGTHALSICSSEVITDDDIVIKLP